MAEQIENGGSGPKIGTHVDLNEQLHTKSVSESLVQQATRLGNSYNINTGTIGLTSTTASGVFYFKNNESPVNGESSFTLDTLIIGIDNQGTQAGACVITIVKNPTSVSFSTDVDMLENRNFGSTNVFSTDTVAYKGAEAATITGGTDFGIIYQNAGTRASYPVDIEIPRGSSIALKIDTQTTAGTTNLYVAAVGHRIEGNNK